MKSDFSLYSNSSPWYFLYTATAQATHSNGGDWSVKCQATDAPQQFSVIASITAFQAMGPVGREVSKVNIFRSGRRLCFPNVHRNHR